jgi:hypothetical protein
MPEVLLSHPSRPRELLRRSDLWRQIDWNSFILRTAAVAAQAATIWITWPLWQVRHYVADQLVPQTPNLPAFSLPQVDVAPWLVGTLVLVMLVPRWGVLLHGIALVWAILLDQIRMQPECISLWVLMLGSLHSPSCKLLARSHLIALWFFAGFHKLISPEYYEAVVPFMMGRAPGTTLAASEIVWGALGALVEMALAVLAVVPRTRRACAVMAVPFHLLVLSWLALRLQWNYSVCPWNAAIAIAALTLVWPWRTTLLADWREAWRPVRVVVAAVLFSPLLFYVGLFDPFLCYCVYTENTPRAWIVRVPSDLGDAIKNGTAGTNGNSHNGGLAPSALTVLPDAELTELSDLRPGIEVAIPPEHRLFEACFEQMAEPGDTLVIQDRRPGARLLGFDHRQIIKQRDTTVVP